MGVIRCNRARCENVMCDLYSHNYGRICSECFSELCDTGPTTDIAEFMASEKKPDESNQSFARYSAEFTNRNEWDE